jgi:dolichol-phosphate mannosyltransferase
MYFRNNGVEVSLAVIVPAYKVANQIINVIEQIPSEVDEIVVVVDACPEGTAQLLKTYTFHRTIHILEHPINTGVGGAMKTGYRKALELGVEIILKIDGDGQMDSSLIPNLVQPIILGHADYTKGNRFYSLRHIKQMPRIRLFGNVLLSFMSKMSTGYYHVFDPTNGFTAIRASALEDMNLDAVDDRYFFESDMLFQLNAVGMKVEDVPTPAIYGNEVSNLRVGHSVFYFLTRHLRNTSRRIAMTYFLRDFSLASIQLVAAVILGTWGFTLGIFTWLHSQRTGLPSQPGTIVLVAILSLSSLQLFLNFINYDMSLSRRSKA